MHHVFYINEELYVAKNFDEILNIIEQHLGAQVTDEIRDHIQSISLDKELCDGECDAIYSLQEDYDKSIREALDILRGIDTKRISKDGLEEAIKLLENATT